MWGVNSLHIVEDVLDLLPTAHASHMCSYLHWPRPMPTDFGTSTLLNTIAVASIALCSLNGRSSSWPQLFSIAIAIRLKRAPSSRRRNSRAAAICDRFTRNQRGGGSLRRRMPSPIALWDTPNKSFRKAVSHPVHNFPSSCKSHQRIARTLSRVHVVCFEPVPVLIAIHHFYFMKTLMYPLSKMSTHRSFKRSAFHFEILTPGKNWNGHFKSRFQTATRVPTPVFYLSQSENAKPFMNEFALQRSHAKKDVRTVPCQLQQLTLYKLSWRLVRNPEHCKHNTSTVFLFQ